MSTHITRSDGHVGQEMRTAALGHGALTVWFTGLSGSGKSTIAHLVEALLVDEGINAYVLDGDNLRFGLCSDLGFSPQDRSENIRRAGEVAALLNAAGVVVLAAFVSPYRADRDRVRAMHLSDSANSTPDQSSLSPSSSGGFMEVYVDTPLEICAQRDPKGLYAKAAAGEITDLTGVGSPYEPPLEPELRLDTTELSEADCAAKVVASVLSRVR